MPGGRLLVVEKSAHSLGVIDLDTGRRVGGITASGVTPHEVVASADGRRAFLPVYGDANVGEPGTDGSAVDVVDLDELEAEIDDDEHHTVELGAPTRPHDAALGVEGRIYVTAELQQAVLVLDPTSGEVVQRLATEQDESHMVALTSDGRRACTVNVGPGSVSVIDIGSDTVERVVELGTRVNRVTITPDDRFAITADQRAPRLAFIDLADGAVAWVDLPAIGYSAAATADGSTLVVGLRPVNQVAILDLARRTIRSIVDVPPTPQRVVIPPPWTIDEERVADKADDRPDDFAYVSCDASDVVVEIDLRTAEIVREFGVGAGPDGMAWTRSRS